MKVFVSYSHAQSDWVRNRLVPCLEAGGAEVLIDWKLFTAGRTVLGQMDSTQDWAEKHILVLSAEHLASPMCVHEMHCALALDPGFVRDIMVPVQRDDAAVPAAIKSSLYVDLRDDTRADQWELLLQACGASLVAAAPDCWRRAMTLCAFRTTGAQSISSYPPRYPMPRDHLIDRSADRHARRVTRQARRANATAARVTQNGMSIEQSIALAEQELEQREPLSARGPGLVAQFRGLAVV
jgi:hypothetical protein